MLSLRHSKNMRVLVVEDEPDIAQFICQGLGESGYAVDWLRMDYRG
jgi:DNA-binding response OmpR family regulator